MKHWTDYPAVRAAVAHVMRMLRLHASADREPGPMRWKWCDSWLRVN